MQFIAEIDLTVAQTFSAIPQTFRHLMVVAILRSPAAVPTSVANMRINGDTGVNYDEVGVNGGNSTANAYSVPTVGAIQVAVIPGATAAATAFSSMELWLPYYAKTTNRKTVNVLSTSDASSTAATLISEANGGTWLNPAAISSFNLFPGAAPGPFAAGSFASLYGLP
jgi:hypothetical protein